MSDKLLPPNAQSVPGNAVKHDDPRVSLLDFATHHPIEFVGRVAQRLDLHDGESAALNHGMDRDADCFAPVDEAFYPLLEEVHTRVFPPTGQLPHEQNAQRGLSDPTGAADQGDHAASHTAVQHLVKLWHTRSDHLGVERPPMPKAPRMNSTRAKRAKPAARVASR